MTEGTNQGLFIIVAVVIFGIFVLISYKLFSNVLNPKLHTIFCDSFKITSENTGFYTNDAFCSVEDSYVVDDSSLKEVRSIYGELYISFLADIAFRNKGEQNYDVIEAQGFFPLYLVDGKLVENFYEDGEIYLEVQGGVYSWKDIGFMKESEISLLNIYSEYDDNITGNCYFIAPLTDNPTSVNDIYLMKKEDFKITIDDYKPLELVESDYYVDGNSTYDILFENFENTLQKSLLKNTNTFYKTLQVDEDIPDVYAIQDKKHVMTIHFKNSKIEVPFKIKLGIVELGNNEK